MTTAQADKAAQAADAKEKGPSPFLRAVSKGATGYSTTLCLWTHGQGERTGIHGFVVVGGQNVQIHNGFFNDKDGKRSITLSQRVDGADGAEDSWKTLGYGHPVNSNKGGDPVYFDTVIFNIGDQVIGARVTKACDQGLRDKIGFTSPQVERPAKAAESETETAAATADRPRG